MKTIKKLNILLIVIVMASNYALAQKAETPGIKPENEKIMHTYLIEREIPEAGKLSKDELKGISQKSCTVLKDMGPKIQWLHSYVTENKVYCVYKAESKEAIKDHAKKAGFPVNSISELSATIGPETAGN